MDLFLLKLSLFFSFLAFPSVHFFADTPATPLWYVNVPVVNMREGPNDKAEIVSQGYFSEEVRVLDRSGGFAKIETVVDHYQGFIPESALVSRNQKIGPSVATVNRIAAHIYSVEDTVYGPICTLPFGSKLELVESNNDTGSRWIKVTLLDGTQAYVQRGDVTLSSERLSMEEIVAFSKRFLELPYTWGGRSSFGYDCSGFVQMLYRQMGIYLPRDSKDQMRFSGFVPVDFDALSVGDLIFFGLAEDKIRHVGMYIGSDQFIHATVAELAPYIRISRLSDSFWNGSGNFKFRAARRLAEK